MTPSPSLPEFQADVARTFFALPEADSFLLAGGLALVALGLTDRPTEDMDAFTPHAGDVVSAAKAFTCAAEDRGWRVESLRSSGTFVRLHVHGKHSLFVDLAQDSAPGLPPTMSVLGPTYAIEELATRKLLALFDRAMPRDFADVYRLQGRVPRQRLMDLAVDIDPGFDPAVLAIALGQLRRYRDEDIPIEAGDVPALRAFFHEWADELG